MAVPDSTLGTPISIGELLRRADITADLAGRCAGALVQDVTCDSRQVRPGSCFVALHGTGGDGHEFVPAAIRAGASAVVVDQAFTAEIADYHPVAVVRVPDGRTALAKLAAGFHLDSREGDNGGLRIVGVTGTNGKSTVTWMLRSILRAAGERVALLGTIEYDLLCERRKASLTTPGAVELCQSLALARQSGATCAAMEVSSHALDQRRCDGLRFHAAVFTNLSGDHLDYHHSMEAYFAAKKRLFELRASDAAAIVNAEDDAGRSLLRELGGRITTFGFTAACDLWADVRACDRTGSELCIHASDWGQEVRLPLVGRHNVANALAAAGAAEAMGASPEAIRTGLEQASHVPGRLQRVEPDGWPFSVFVDYAHTDAALENVLTALRPLTAGRLLCIFGCGGDRDRTKRPRMGAVVGRLADAAYVTSDNPRSERPAAIIDEILPGLERATRCRVVVEPDRRAAILRAIGEARTGDTVLIAGKGHEDYQIVGATVHPFDDVEVASRILDALRPSEDAPRTRGSRNTPAPVAGGIAVRNGGLHSADNGAVADVVARARVATREVSR